MLRSTSRIACALFLIVSAAFPRLARSQALWEPLTLEEPAVRGEPRADLREPGLDFERLRYTPAAVIAPEYVLPAPARPHILFGDEPGEAPGVAARYRGMPIFHASSRPTVRVAAIYDTGHVGSGSRLFPSTIALDGTRQARQRGHFQVSPNSTMLELSVASPDQRLRTDIQFDLFDTVRVRQFRGQAADLPFGGILYGGSTYTTFMDEHAVPISIMADTTAAGAVYRIQPQLGYWIPVGRCWSTSVAIEHGPEKDSTLLDPVDDVRLYRYPDLVLRLRYASSRVERTNSTFHVAALVRGMGYEDITSSEHFATGWGVSVMGKMRVWGRDKLLAGCVGGEGIGSYIFGFTSEGPNNMPAAGPDAGRLTALSNIGAHIGYKRVWCPDRFLTHLGYGYAHADTTVEMPTGVKDVHNLWMNHQWRVSNTVSFGVEYHYAIRELREGTQGDTHRVLFAAQFLN